MFKASAKELIGREEDENSYSKNLRGKGKELNVEINVISVLTDTVTYWYCLIRERVFKHSKTRAVQ